MPKCRSVNCKPRTSSPVFARLPTDGADRAMRDVDRFLLEALHRQDTVRNEAPRVLVVLESLAER